MKKFLITTLATASLLHAGRRAVINFDGSDNGEDLALIGGTGWNTMPVYRQYPFFPNGTWGMYYLSNSAVGNFNSWVNAPGAKIIPGDFNNDGKTDVALIGGDWTTIPLAFSNGDGSFRISNAANSQFAQFARQTGVRIIPGDFNNDYKTDIALVGGTNWNSIPIAFSNGDGSFSVTNNVYSNFAQWARGSEVDIKGGDFDGDGYTDIALVGGAGWSTVPIAYGLGNGSFDVRNISAANFADWASRPGSQKIAADFTGDGKTDIAIANSNFSTIPVMIPGARGSLTIANNPTDYFGSWFSSARQILVTDVDRDGKEDMVLTGGSGWTTAPYVHSRGSGSFDVWNLPFNTNFPNPIPSSAIMVPVCCENVGGNTWYTRIYELNGGYQFYPGEKSIPFLYFSPTGRWQWSIDRGQNIPTDVNTFQDWVSRPGVRVVNLFTYPY